MTLVSSSRKMAINLEHSRYWTGKPCKHGHLAWRTCPAGMCMECARQHTAKRLREDPAYREMHRRQTREYKRRVLADPARRSQIREYEREASKSPSRKAKSVRKVTERRLLKLKATPPWLSSEDRAKIEAIYQRARELTRLTGIQHEVDHVVPLKGEAVCGLHVPWNLQVLTQSENAAKGNR